ncbi:MAG: hypothetical protein M3Q22_13810 [Actinomycetota bacterium]|nr:hypothetical protein [Actinomycetota bacterium]
MPEHTAHRIDHSWCPSPTSTAGRRLPARLRHRRALVVPPCPATVASRPVT